MGAFRETLSTLTGQSLAAPSDCFVPCSEGGEPIE
jgi:hypothetical protein